MPDHWDADSDVRGVEPNREPFRTNLIANDGVTQAACQVAEHRKRGELRVRRSRARCHDLDEAALNVEAPGWATRLRYLPRANRPWVQSTCQLTEKRVLD